MATTIDLPAARRTGKRWMGMALAALLLALSMGMLAHGAAVAKEAVAGDAPVIDISVVLNGHAIVAPGGGPPAACASSSAVLFALESAPFGPGAVVLAADATSGAIDAGNAPAVASAGAPANAAATHPGYAVGIAA